MIVGILSKIMEINKLVKNETLKIGSKLNESHKNKSTEVFHVEYSNNMEHDTKKLIDKIDNKLSEFIDDSFTNHRKEIDIIFNR